MMSPVVPMELDIAVQEFLFRPVRRFPVCALSADPYQHTDITVALGQHRLCSRIIHQRCVTLCATARCGGSEGNPITFTSALLPRPHSSKR